jgi:hypothetical protein
VQALPYRTKGPDVSEGFHNWYISAPSNPAVALIVDWLPDWTRETAFGLAIWSWIGLLFSLVVGTALMVVAYRLQRKYAAVLQDGKVVRYCLTIVFPVMAMFIPWASPTRPIAT